VTARITECPGPECDSSIPGELNRIPTLIAPGSIAYARESARASAGRCFSCGEAHPSPSWYGRCPACDVAADIFYSTFADSETPISVARTSPES
jgi:hypothetical protein